MSQSRRSGRGDLSTIIIGAALCLAVVSCGETGGGESAESPVVDTPQLATVEGLGTVELIALLAHPNELTRTRAHEVLHRHLVVETVDPEYPNRLTRFHKYAPHACKKGHEAQTLHILGLFAAQEDVSSILVKQCLRSEHAQVRATALELAHFSDNRIDAELLVFEPDQMTLASYVIALRKLGTAEALGRLAEVGGG